MKEAKTKRKNELLPGTLEMLILKTLSIESMHGYGIAQHIQMLSAAVLTIEEGSLYPALQRMRVKGWVAAEWRTFGEQPPSALLHAHAGREEAARHRGIAILPDVRRDHARDENGVVSDSGGLRWVLCSDVCCSSSSGISSIGIWKTSCAFTRN
jgi:DNA-binding PadR family transcriptional regulator